MDEIELPLTASNDKLDGLTLYFNFIKYLTILMLFLSLALVYPIQDLLNKQKGDVAITDITWLQLDKLMEPKARMLEEEQTEKIFQQAVIPGTNPDEATITVTGTPD